jgi:hypothetical protein
MIDPKELRIGNWVHGYSSNYEHVPSFFQIESLNEWQINPYFACDGETWYAKEVKPIKITPEILVKCGFTWNDHWLELNLKFCNWYIRFSNGRYDRMCIFQYQNADRQESASVHISFGMNCPEYLHKLQNIIFALTGTELIIEL